MEKELRSKFRRKAVEKPKIINVWQGISQREYFLEIPRKWSRREMPGHTFVILGFSTAFRRNLDRDSFSIDWLFTFSPYK